MRILATAPAKLFLVGEYAVVEGAPAVVAAVDRRVRVHVEDRDGETWTYRTDAEGGARRVLRLDDAGRLVNEAGRPAEEDGATRLLAVALAESLGSLRAGLPRALDVSIESRTLHADDGGHKLGLGSSAAVMVALGAALRARGAAGEACERPGPDEALDLDLAAHRALQGGRGSGADVAASHRGGIIRFERLDPATVRCRSIQLPPELQMRCFWTGRSAKTSDFLGRAAELRLRAPSAWQGHMDHLGTLAEEAADAFEKANTQAFLDACTGYAEGLAALGDALGAPIVSAPHRALSVLASQAGAVYKPSGAGGGDIGVAFGVDLDGLERMVAAAARAGYPTVRMGVDPHGVETLER